MEVEVFEVALRFSRLTRSAALVNAVNLRYLLVYKNAANSTISVVRTCGTPFRLQLCQPVMPFMFWEPRPE